MPRTRDAVEVRAVFDLKARGHTDRELADLTGVPVNTIRAWRNRSVSTRALREMNGGPRCPVCDEAPHDFASLPAVDYAYLLGVYLGDGCLGHSGHSWSLRIVLDEAYPGIVASCCDAIEIVRGTRPIPRPYPGGERCVIVASTWRQWPCLFPQHGPGRKHRRKIELTDWQRAIVDGEPGSFLRGLIHTDGWRGVNKVRAKGKDYVYPRYQFSNRSDDIRKLFTDACDRLGIEWRPWTRWHISVARSDSVLLLDTFVGPKT